MSGQSCEGDAVLDVDQTLSTEISQQVERSSMGLTNRNRYTWDGGTLQHFRNPALACDMANHS